jgi:hypothetical protein
MTARKILDTRTPALAHFDPPLVQEPINGLSLHFVDGAVAGETASGIVMELQAIA